MRSKFRKAEAKRKRREQRVRQKLEARRARAKKQRELERKEEEKQRELDAEAKKLSELIPPTTIPLTTSEEQRTNSNTVFDRTRWLKQSRPILQPRTETEFDKAAWQKDVLDNR